MPTFIGWGDLNIQRQLGFGIDNKVDFVAKEDIILILISPASIRVRVVSRAMAKVPKGAPLRQIFAEVVLCASPCFEKQDMRLQSFMENSEGVATEQSRRTMMENWCRERSWLSEAKVEETALVQERMTDAMPNWIRWLLRAVSRLVRAITGLIKRKPEVKGITPDTSDCLSTRTVLDS